MNVVEVLTDSIITNINDSLIVNFSDEDSDTDSEYSEEGEYLIIKKSDFEFPSEPPSYSKSAKDYLFDKVTSAVKSRINKKLNKKVILYISSYLTNLPYFLLSFGYDCIIEDPDYIKLTTNFLSDKII